MHISKHNTAEQWYAHNCIEHTSSLALLIRSTLFVVETKGVYLTIDHNYNL